MKGYKAFKKGLIWGGKQYKENTTFEEDTVKIYKEGIHFCQNPLDCLEYYPLIDENGEFMEFAEVEALEEPVTKDDIIFATKKLHIGEKLSLHDYIKASVDFIFEKCKETEKTTCDYMGLASEGLRSRLATTGECSRLASAGASSNLVSAGAFSCLASAGFHSGLVSEERYSNLVSAGAFSNLVSAGAFSNLVSAGEYSRLVSAGEYSHLASAGGGSSLKAGENSSLTATGAFSSLTAGENSIVAGIGYKNRAKAAKGSWIVLAEYEGDDEYNGDDEYDKDDYTPICVKAAQVDGEKIKANTWYELKDGEFTEAT